MLFYSPCPQESSMASTGALCTHYLVTYWYQLPKLIHDSNCYPTLKRHSVTYLW